MKPLYIPAEEQNILINQLTENYIRRFFSSGKKHIIGPEILHFCDNQQVNRFIFFQLHQDWNKYQADLVHPAYNFQHEEVKKALQTFLNILSAHILISERDFRPFVEKAVFNTLSLLLNPEDTFSGFYFSAKEGINLSLLEKNASYFSYFDFILQGIIVFHKQNNMPLVRKRIFIEKFQKAEIIAGKKGKSLENYRRELFQKFTGNDLFEIARTADGTIPVPELPAGKEQGSEAMATFSGEQNIMSSITQEIASPEISEDIKVSEPETEASNDSPEIEASINIPEETEKKEANFFDSTLQNHIEPLFSEITEHSSPVVENGENREERVDADLPETIEAHSTTIDATAETGSNHPATESKQQNTSEKKPTLADTFQKKTKQNLNLKSNPIRLDTIPIHKQFQFSQKVFLGNNIMFREFLLEINKIESLEEAQKQVNEKVIIPNRLQEDDPLLLEFLELIENRYTES